MASPPSVMPSLPQQPAAHEGVTEASIASSSSASPTVHDFNSTTDPTGILAQPTTRGRMPGTDLIPADSDYVELKDDDEVFGEDDARAMSPRRSSQDLERMSQEARAHLNEHARILQESLLEIFNRIEAVKEEHDKLDNNNKFLQKYIGDLMSTSKITSTGAANRKK